MKYLLTALIALSLTACVSMQDADTRVQAWKNTQLNTLIKAWGLPDKEQVIANRKFYVWNTLADSSSPTIGISVGTGGRRGGISLGTILGGDSEQNYCSRVVEVDANDNIIGIQWNGDPSLCFDVTPELITQEPITPEQPSS